MTKNATHNKIEKSAAKGIYRPSTFERSKHLCQNDLKRSPSIGMRFRHQGFKLMMHAGTLKSRGDSHFSAHIVKVSSIRPESAQPGTTDSSECTWPMLNWRMVEWNAATTSVNKAAQESPSRCAQARNNRTVWEAKSHTRTGLRPP